MDATAAHLYAVRCQLPHTQLAHTIYLRIVSVIMHVCFGVVRLLHCAYTIKPVF